MDINKLCLYYDNDTDEILIIKANGILESDKIVKELGFNPMKLIYTGLKICTCEIVDELRKFAYYLKDKQGKLVVDDFGDHVWIEEYHNVDKEQITTYDVKTFNDYKNLLDKVEVIYTYSDFVYIPYGNNKRKHISIEDFYKLIKN
jgi:hypothetical protein